MLSSVHVSSSNTISLEFNKLFEHDSIFCQLLGTNIINATDKEIIFLSAAKRNKLRVFSHALAELPFFNNIKDENENYAIHWAVKNHNVDMLQLLLNNNVNYNIKNRNGDTALDIAFSTGDKECAKAILNYENPVFKSSSQYLINSIRSNDEELFFQMINRECLWDEKDTTTTPLHVAVQKNNLKIVTALCSMDFTKELNDQGESALDLAFQYQAERKTYSETNKEVIAQVQKRHEFNLLKKAFVEYDLAKVKQHLHYGQIPELHQFFKKLPDMKQNHKNNPAIKYLAERNLLPDLKDFKYENLNQMEVDQISEMIAVLDSLVNYQETKTETHLGKLILKILLKNAKTSLNSDIYFKSDLYCLNMSLLLAIKDSESDTELKNKVLEIFEFREDAILNSSMDYCYSKNSIANKICYEIALLFCDKDTSPYQLLLKKARTDGRVWQNPVEMTEALPDPAAFFRTSQNAIHITADVVFQAIARLKQGKNHSSHIWFGTDDKNIRPVPALTPEELATLKKRSKTLNVLIEYIHKLEDVQKKSTNVYTKLNYFKDALFANSVRDKKTNTATEDAADEKLNPIIAEMGEWWNSLHPEIQGHIKSLRESSGNHNSIAKVMDVIFSVKDVKDHKRQTDINYCVYLKADMLEKVLRDTAVQAALKNIGHDLELAKVKVDDHILDEWEKAILTELETPQDIFLPEAGAFGSILNYNINLILMRKMPYHFFKGGQKNFEADILLLQKFILNEPDFNELKFIAICLEDPSYQYLHTSNFIKTFLKLLQNDEHKSYENFCRSSEVFSLTPSADTIKILLPWSIQHEKLYFIRYLMGNGKKSLLDVWQNEKSYLQFFQENYSPDLLNKLYELLSQSEDIILDLIQRNDLTNAKIFMTISQIKENTEFLVEATRLENLDLVDFILQQGKPVDVIKALSIVKKSQNTAIFEKLLSYLKMHPEMLKKGVEIKDSEILDTLLQIPFEERAEWQVPELKNNYLIHYAVLKNNHSLLTKALDKKIDVDALNMQQESALEIAIQKDHTSLIKTLLEHGAKKCKNPEKYFIKLINDREPTIASLLLESIPFEVGAEDDLGKTAFHYALIKGYKFLAIQIIGKIENPVKTSILNTALDWAISAHLHNEVMFIIKQGATNSRYSSDYLTSIMRNDDVASAIIFIDSLKCQFYFNNQIKDTALHYIVEKNQLLLLKKTLNKMAGDNQETLNSALSLAMKCNDLEIIKLLLTHGAKSTNSIDKFCYKNLCKLDANFQKILLEGMILPDKKTKDTYQQDDLRSIILYAKTLSQEMKESKNSNIVEYQALRNMHHSEEEPSSLFSFMYRKCTDEVMLKLKNLKNTDQSSIFHPDFFRLYDEALKKLVLDDFQNDLHALNYIYHFFHYFTEMNLEMWRDMSSMISSLRYHILYLKRNDVMTRFSSYTNAISVINQLCYQLSSQFVNFSDAELSQLTDPAGWTNPTIAFEISIFSSLFDFIFVKNHEGNFKSRLENPKKVELLLNYIFSESLNSRLGELHTQLKVIEKDCQSTAELKTFHLIDKSLSLQIIKNIIHDYPDDFASVLKDSYEKYPFIKNYKYQSDSFFYYDCRLTTLFNKSRSTQASLQILDKEIHEVRKL